MKLPYPLRTIAFTGRQRERDSISCLCISLVAAVREVLRSFFFCHSARNSSKAPRR